MKKTQKHFLKSSIKNLPLFGMSFDSKLCNLSTFSTIFGQNLQKKNEKTLEDFERDAKCTKRNERKRIAKKSSKHQNEKRYQQNNTSLKENFQQKCNNNKTNS